MSQTNAVSSASELQMDFMKLLVTQLQNQNPLEPMDNQDMAAQLAQFSQLQQLENMNSSFGQVLKAVQTDYAGSLMGKDVSFVETASDGTLETRTGRVEEVVLGGDDITLLVGNYQVRLADVLSIRD